MVRKGPGILLLAVLLSIPVIGILAEGDLSMELGISNLILQTRDESNEKYWSWLTAGSADFSYKSSGSRNVKAEVSFGFTGSDTPVLSLERAYVKARFPWFRLTAGKTRLSWGEGFVFNAGDVLFGSTDTSVDLTASEVRTETAWLTALNIPLGRFSFIEGVILQPPVSSSDPFGRFDEASVGGRLYTKLGGIKIEAGYFLDQTDIDTENTVLTLHKPYIALQGNFITDWYLSSSATLSSSNGVNESVKDSLNISGGLFHMVSLNSISSLTFRLEGLYKPFQSWVEESHLNGEALPSYALMLYPEISWTPTDTVSLSIRSLWSPVDNSAMFTAGAGWNVFEGFDLSCYGLLNAGDADDTFSWDRDNDLWAPETDVIDKIALIIGVNYIY